MKVATLFTGIGGFDLGFERAGMDCVAQVEIDKHAQSVLKRHFSSAKLFDDVQQVKGCDLGPIDVISGGFPCQDVSLAGRRAGLAGERSGLWFEFQRILGQSHPRVVVIENVPGLLSSNGGRDFACILRGLEECGYRSAWRVLDSQHFGVPQRRRRLYVVGCLGDGRAAEILFEREGGSGNTATGRPTGQSITCTPEGIAGAVATKWAKGSGGPAGDERYNLIAGTLVSNRLGTSKTRRADLIVNVSAPRRLTPVECERLQGFPDGWTAGQSDAQRYKQLGNAVTVNVAEWLGKRIMEAYLERN